MSKTVTSFWHRVVNSAKHLEILVKGIGPVVAALWIGLQYQQSRIDKRVEATLGYVTRFEADNTSIGKGQRALVEALWEHKDEIAEFRATRGTASDIQNIQRVISLRVLKTASKRIGSDNTFSPLDEIDDFFNGLATCVQGAVCDETAARRYFGCAIVGYLQSFDPILRERAAAAPSFGWGLRWISDRGKGDVCQQ